MLHGSAASPVSDKYQSVPLSFLIRGKEYESRGIERAYCASLGLNPEVLCRRSVLELQEVKQAAD